MSLFVYILLALVALFFLSGLRLLYQYERGVVFTLGKYKTTKEPGLNWIIPFIQTMRKVDMRIITADIPKQEVLTKDNIQLLVNAVVYFRVEKPVDALTKIEDYQYAVRQFTQTALRDVVGNSEMDHFLMERVDVATRIKTIVDSETSGWGVDIESIKIQEIELPAEMKRAMAKQAEAERERRAVIISAEGELKASENLRKAADNLSPVAVHLRTLQTLKDIAAEPSQKIVIFVPSDLGETLKQIVKK